ncbi:wash complex subunit strumpellin [Anaeramoeba ignava]|uniref:Wash complex subunit strumpellin n=1 Tax=Anaeramoeba ignava TaxID=1746090 RepID=A0A9Q0LM90_ANAIG|nr:wash complex subunit strumpellin [Anaeramoeba ignava]
MDIEEVNLAIVTSLKLSSRGNAIIAELFRLSDNIPEIYKNEPEKIHEFILMDFQYLTQSGFVENQISENPTLSEMDEQFQENYFQIIERFYWLFESIYIYFKDLLKFFQDLKNGIFIQFNLETFLMDADGKQLMCEIIYLFGVMLLFMDQKIPGPIRERLLVAYFRYQGQNHIETFDKICEIWRNTGYIHKEKKPPNYPEIFFERAPLPKEVISIVINKLQSDDIYSQFKTYPHTEHQTTAYANQASMIYIILFFSPEILQSNSSVMRAIVDKFFNDNYVISIYIGEIVDLSIEWDSYKAAKRALKNVLKPTKIRKIVSSKKQELVDLKKDLEKYLTEGFMTENYVVDHVQELIDCSRRCNVALRWVLLHSSTQNKKVSNLITFDRIQVLNFLLDIAQFEFLLKEHLKRLLKSKDEQWENYKREASQSLKELSEYFSGERSLARVEKDENIQNWFVNLSKDVQELETKNAGRKIQSLIEGIETIKGYHQIDGSLQIKQFLDFVKSLLHQMIKIINIKDETLATLSIVSDVSYGWEILEKYIDLMQECITRDPDSVIKLRSTFLKLSSILDLPLSRINQSKSTDFVSVSQYYSSELVGYVQKVLEIVPKTVFSKLKEIINLQINNIKEIPPQIQRDQLKDFVQLEARNHLSSKTNEVSRFTKGILAMKKTLVGVIQVDPKELLELGIRRELVKQIAEILHSTIFFLKSGKGNVFEQKLQDLSIKLDGFRRSFEYISDYLNIYGLQIWLEEFSRIVNYNVEQECNSFLKKKVYDEQSMFQSKSVPIPKFKKVDSASINFMGRLARELIRKTDPSQTTYIHLMSDSIGVAGLYGLDKLYAFMIVRKMQIFLTEYKTAITKNTKFQTIYEEIETRLNEKTFEDENKSKIYAEYCQKTATISDSFLYIVMQIGQLQILRRQISNELNFICKLDSNILFSALESMNEAFISDIQAHYQKPEIKPYVNDSLLSELTMYLDTCGMNDPLMKIYVTTEPIQELPLVILFLVISNLNQLSYNPRLCTLVGTKKSKLDGVPFVVGIFTLLKQFHSSHLERFLDYLGQYIRVDAYQKYQKEVKIDDLSQNSLNLLVFLEQFSVFGDIPQKVLQNFIPGYIIDYLKV